MATPQAFLRAPVESVYTSGPPLGRILFLGTIPRMRAALTAGASTAALMAYSIPQGRSSQHEDEPYEQKIQKIHTDSFEQTLGSVDKQMPHLEHHKGRNPGNTGLEHRDAQSVPACAQFPFHSADSRYTGSI